MVEPDRTPNAAEWDERYAGAERAWSGEPNGALIAETAHLVPGRALDVGCGEGADAVWLARRGWDVTGLDVSGVALERAARHSRDAGVPVEWVHAGLVEAGLPAGTFDLVSAHYLSLAMTPEAVGEHTLIDLVARGGTLLVVHHHLEPGPVHDEHDGGNRHAHRVLPSDVLPLLDAGWLIEVDELRPRAISSGAGARHTQDLVLRARRR